MRYVQRSYAADLLIRFALSWFLAATTAAVTFTYGRPSPPGSARRALACLPAALLLLLAAPPLVLDREREAIAITPVVGVFSLAAFKVRCQTSRVAAGWSRQLPAAAAGWLR
jgi:hypothetical protein